MTGVQNSNIRLSSKVFKIISKPTPLMSPQDIPTIIFWDPQKMAERLRKQSNAVKHILPGKQTENYLARRIRFASYIGGSALAGLLVIYGSVKNLTGNAFLMQVNITSFSSINKFHILFLK